MNDSGDTERSTPSAPRYFWPAVIVYCTITMFIVQSGWTSYSNSLASIDSGQVQQVVEVIPLGPVAVELADPSAGWTTTVGFENAWDTPKFSEPKHVVLRQ